VVDRNGYFVVRSTGYAAGNTVVTVEALMKPMPWPAIVTNGDLLFEGTPKVLGDGGSVHSNSDIRVNGNGTEIEKDVTAVGTVDTGAWSGPEDGIAEGGQLPISLPHVLVSDYLSQAKYRLGSDGAIYLIAGNHQICNSNASCAALEFGWSSQAGAHVSGRADILRTWDVGSKPSTLAECNTLNAALAAAGDPSPDCGQGVFYVEHGDIEVKASSKLGEAPQVPSPFKLTLLVDGSVDAAGRAVISAYLEHPRLLLVTEGDLEITGHMTFSGQVRVREQFRLAGTMDLTGQILVENDGDISSKVHENKMEGTATVTNDRLAVYDFAVAGWREFRR
jgi:cytoskeletal protein CcmA (bactofilin family)